MAKLEMATSCEHVLFARHFLNDNEMRISFFVEVCW